MKSHVNFSRVSTPQVITFHIVMVSVLLMTIGCTDIMGGNDQEVPRSELQGEESELLAFSHNEGLKESAFYLSLDTALKGAEIYFTLDGSIPQPNSLSDENSATNLYTEPFRVHRDAGVIPGLVTIRAKAVTPNGIRTETHSRSYLIALEGESVPVDIPVLYIDTPGRSPVVSRSVWMPGTGIALVNVPQIVGSSYDDSNTTIAVSGSIKGRGNSTWAMPKKPYSLNLDDATSLLGMPAHRRWVLLANYSDKTLLRTELAFRMAYELDRSFWTPQSRQVHVVSNGHYQGVYQLTEQIQIAWDRVNVPDISDVTAIPDGGFIVEIDFRRGQVHHFRSTIGWWWFNVRRPNEIDDQTFTFIRDSIHDIERILYSDAFASPVAGYRRHLEIQSFINWFLVNEIAKNVDAYFWTSVFMYYCPKNQRLFMGPVWDFDISSGNINYAGGGNPLGWHVQRAGWIRRLFDDPWFVEQVKITWEEQRDFFFSLPEYIDERAEHLLNAQQLNFERWPILSNYVWPNAVVTGSYEGEIEYLKEWLVTRIAWLDEAINDL